MTYIINKLNDIIQNDKYLPLKSEHHDKCINYNTINKKK